MIRERETVIRRAILLIDGMLVSFAYILSYFLRERLDSHSLSGVLGSIKTVQGAEGTFSEYLIFLLLIITFWCLMLYFSGMYLPLRTRSFLETLWILVKSAFFANLGFGMFVFLFKLSFVNRMFFVLFAIISFAFIFTEKVVIYLAMYSLRKQGLNQKRLLIVGTGRRAAGDRPSARSRATRCIAAT